MIDIKEIIKKYPTGGNFNSEKSFNDLLKNAERLFQEATIALSDEISGIRTNQFYNTALSAAFQVASNALIQPYADKDYLEDIREAFLSSAVSVSTIRKVPNDE